MYLTRFTKTDGQVEDYLYDTQEEARAHLNAFLNDDSGLYKNISVFDNDPSMTILSILPFRHGKPIGIINAGDIVRLSEEFSRPEERHDLYVVKHISEVAGRYGCVKIQCITTDMYFKPIETVGVEMIELVPKTE